MSETNVATDQPRGDLAHFISDQQSPPATESPTVSPDSTTTPDAAKELDTARKEIRRLQVELDEARSLVAVANYSLEESLETERRKCREEVATLQQLMKGLCMIFKL